MGLQASKVLSFVFGLKILNAIYCFSNGVNEFDFLSCYKKRVTKKVWCYFRFKSSI